MAIAFFRYTWKKDNVQLEIEMDDNLSLQGGDLSIRFPSKKDDGSYQCFATNDFGTAASTRIAVNGACK